MLPPFNDNYWLLRDDLIFEAVRASDQKLFNTTSKTAWADYKKTISNPAIVPWKSEHAEQEVKEGCSIFIDAAG